MALTFTYTKTPVALDSLRQSISQSTIAVAQDLTTTSVFGDQLTVGFKADLSGSEVTTLDAIVAAHTGVPLVVTPPTQPVSMSAACAAPKNRWAKAPVLLRGR